MDDERLTIEDAAQLLQVGTGTVQAWIERGLTYAEDSDGTVLILRRDLNDFLAQEGQGMARDAASET